MHVVHRQCRLRVRTRHRTALSLVGICVAQCIQLSLASGVLAVSSGNPTLLVNTESFYEIDDGDPSTNVELRFGELAAEKLYWNVGQSRFQFTDDLHVENNLTGSGGLAIEQNIRAKGNLTFNSDNEATDAVLTFGNATLARTLQFIHASQKFRFSTSLEVAGTISGSLLKAANLTVSGALVFSSGGTLTQTARGSSGQLLMSQGMNAPQWADPNGAMVWFIGGTLAAGAGQGADVTMPFGMTVSSVSLRVKTAPTGQALIVDINENGSTLFSTRPQIDAASTTGGGSASFSDTTLAPGSVITVDIDQIGSGTAGADITIMLNGTRKY